MVFPERVRAAIHRLEAFGFEAYAVGGCVRDSLLGLLPHDWDLACSATPEEMLACFSAPPFRTVVGNGLRHGTVTVIWNNDTQGAMEITSFRRECGYSDGRRPDSVLFSRSLEEDLARRDFTVNAMAARPTAQGEELVDLWNGREDLMNGLICAVRDPFLRMSEDSLRILRGLRFAARFGFSVEAKTAEAMRALAPRLSCLAKERVLSELLQFLEAPYAGRVADSFATVFSVVMERPVPDRIEQRFNAATEVQARLAVLLGQISPQQAAAHLRAMTCSEALVGAVSGFIEAREAPLTDRLEDGAALLRRFEAALPVYYAYRRAMGASEEEITRSQHTTNRILETGLCYKISMLSVSGRDFIEAGVKPGPEIGRMLSAALTLVVQQIVPNSRQELLTYLLKNEKNNA